MIRYLLAATAVAAIASPVAAQTTLNATFQGTATTNRQTPDPGLQIFTLNGAFLSYIATGNLPQVLGGDINRYRFTVSGTSQAFDATTRTTTYGGVSGLIYYDLNGDGAYDPNNDPLVQGLTAPTLTATFDPLFQTAALLSTLNSTGPVQFGGNTIDLRPANGAIIAGTYISNGPQNGTVTGTITFPGVNAAVPEPATWGLMIAGFGMVGASMRRRKVAVRFA